MLIRSALALINVAPNVQSGCRIVSFPGFPTEVHHGAWLRLRTLVFVRWAAVLGQSLAVAGAIWIFGLTLDYGLASIAIAASVIANMAVTLLTPPTRRMSERVATLMLAFDVVQLGLLLSFTGGLNNPFALLLLAPVTIAATILPLRNTVGLALMSLAMVSAIGLWSLPIRDSGGVVLELPGLFRFGFWLALIIGVLFLAIYARQVATEIREMREALAVTQLALAREQQLTALGGVVAAAAHELGTPLATIKLASSELVDVLRGRGDLVDLYDDAVLIRAQADRCRDILRSMGREGKDDLHLRGAPFETVLREAAEPHLGRGREVSVLVATPGNQPVIQRRPEIIHGLRNLVQNAVDFSVARVAIELSWSEARLSVRIVDDGPGFPPHVLSRIGDPFVHGRRRESAGARPEYEGMGLGLFIAKTLLERSGARLDFANGDGAIVQVDWPAERILAATGALGANPRIEE
ncbi:MAG: ActS/PrrB/RegB family redox-sensitive histidine kinase [Rubellimicrobium sp.]|nr:ActS/PrrB/RegB family redox-sensitive histidine kinase [Rubellimicrobium sp.]